MTPLLKRSGIAIAVGAVLTALGHPLLAGLDAHLVSGGLFPAGPPATGLDPVLAATICALALGRGPWRRASAALITGVLSIIATWGMRYLVGIVHGAALASALGPGSAAHTRYQLIAWGVAAMALAIGLYSSRMHLGRARDWAIQLGLVGLSVVGADGIVRLLDVDVQLMNRALYYQTVEIEVHTPSDDPQLLYRLQPGAVLGGEGPWGLRTVRVNALGARSPEYGLTKPAGVQRILFFGGSTLYGAGVSNAQTTPARLEQLLGPGHEVWNFGACAYNTAQAARLAQIELERLDPDLILLMITNTGRRAFMGGPAHKDADKSDYFAANPHLYLENFPPTAIDENTHLWLMRLSALYRSAAAFGRVFTDPDTTYADRADQEQIDKLEALARSRGVKVLYFLSPSRGSEIGAADLGIEEHRWFDLNRADMGPQFSQAHPSPAVLQTYAQMIAARLE